MALSKRPRQFIQQLVLAIGQYCSCHFIRTQHTFGMRGQNVILDAGTSGTMPKKSDRFRISSKELDMVPYPSTTLGFQYDESLDFSRVFKTSRRVIGRRDRNFLVLPNRPVTGSLKKWRKIGKRSHRPNSPVIREYTEDPKPIVDGNEDYVSVHYIAWPRSKEVRFTVAAA